MFRFPRTLRSRYGRFRQGRVPIRGIFSGLAMVRRSQLSAIGSEVFADSSRSPTFGEKTERQNVAIRTCSATHSRLRCCLGVPLEQVSILLGHKSVKITEKHYAPWVKARQELLAANVRKAWTVLQNSGKKSRRKQPQRVKTA